MSVHTARELKATGYKNGRKLHTTRRYKILTLWYRQQSEIKGGREMSQIGLYKQK
jgi:hypothetical protein